MDELEYAGLVNHQQTDYYVYWDSSNGEIWYSTDKVTKKTFKNLSCRFKKDAKDYFEKFLQGQSKI